ncbi:MAG: PAS domain S-box protein, partial [Thermodesulfovibrionales bacterium]|nr:PAS domain S-box protein [Thermodesulfovibrionales bacterium]
MNDTRKTKDELIRELRSLRRKVTALEKSKEGAGAILREGKAKKKSVHKAETFRDFLEDSPLPYQSLDKNGIILDINQIWLDILGYKRKEVVGRHFNDFLAPDYHEKFGECFRQFKQTNTANNIELELVQKNGIRKMLSFHGKIKLDEKGNFLRTHCIFQDITGQQKAEKELRFSREKYQYLVENLNDAIYTVSPEGIILYVSPVIKNILGYTPPELIGRPFAELIHPEDLDRIMKEFRDVLAGRLYPGEYRLIKKNGASCWVRTSSRPLYENNRVVWIHGILAEITERKDMEEALKKSYDELRLILDATTEGIWQRDFMKNKLYFSEKWYTMLGYEPFEFPASHENWKALLHPEDRKQALAVAEKYLETKPDKHENEFRLKTKDGQYRWIRSHAKVVERDKNGEAVRLIGHHQDITEYKLAEEIIKDQAKFLKTLIDTIPIPVFYKDREGHYTGFNKAFETFVGKSGDQMLGKNVFEVYEREPKEIPERYYESDQELLEHPGTYHYEWKMMNISGELRDVIIDKATILGDRNSIEGIIGVMTDITERKKAENILAEKMHELERLNRLFIGREHRMVELKKEVNALLEQLGQKKKYKAPDQAEPSMGP